jgi:hypothetical protein
MCYVVIPLSQLLMDQSFSFLRIVQIPQKIKFIIKNLDYQRFFNWLKGQYQEFHLMPFPLICHENGGNFLIILR